VILLPLAVAAGCVSTQTRDRDMTILFMPVYDDRHPIMRGMGSSYEDLRWFSNPDSHPAVRARPAAQPVAPSSAGARVDALSPDATLSAGVTVQGGRAAESCRPVVNQGTFLGAIGGGLLGSLLGSGRWRQFWIALGVAGGALRGTEMVADGRRCG